VNSEQNQQPGTEDRTQSSGVKIVVEQTSHVPEEISLSPEEARARIVQADFFYKQVSILSEIVLEIDAARSRDEVFQVLRNELRWILEHDVCFVGLLNKDRTHYVIRTLSAVADAADINDKLFAVNQGVPGLVIQQQAPIVLDVQAGPTSTESIDGTLAELGMKSLLVVPLRTGDETIGSLTLSSAKPGIYHEQETWLTQLLGLQVAIALKNIALFDDAKKRITQIEMVNEIAEKLTSTLNLDELLHSVSEAIRKNFGYSDVTMFLVDRANDEALLVAHSGEFSNFLPTGYRQKLSQGIVGWVGTHGQRVVSNDVLEDPRYMTYEYHGTRSELAVPIRVQHEIVGVLNVEDSRPLAFDETDAIILEILCDQLGSAIRNAKLYEEVKAANAKLTELDRLKSDFLGIVSHDFRSPLASIILAAKALLRRGDFTDVRRIQDYLKIIIDQGTKLSHLAEDTLSITRMESGQLTYMFRVVNVERLFTDAAALVNFSRRHTLEHSVDTSVAYIKGDQSKLRQVVQNLLSNAVKYSPEGGLIRLTAEDYSEDEIVVSVMDEGIGIPADQTDRLFKKFSRIDTPQAREIKGSGLGLWICKEIVRAHGGRIWVESTPGRGSNFRFTLKKVQSDSRHSP